MLTGEDITKQDDVLAKHHKECLTQLTYIIKKSEIEEKEMKKQSNF
jgi:hypothetical protein